MCFYCCFPWLDCTKRAVSVSFFHPEGPLPADTKGALYLTTNYLCFKGNVSKVGALFHAKPHTAAYQWSHVLGLRTAVPVSHTTAHSLSGSPALTHQPEVSFKVDDQGEDGGLSGCRPVPCGS